jgi:hypothetical protein
MKQIEDGELKIKKEKNRIKTYFVRIDGSITSPFGNFFWVEVWVEISSFFFKASPKSSVSFWLRDFLILENTSSSCSSDYERKKRKKILKNKKHKYILTN